MTSPPSEDWVEERRRHARSAPVVLLVFIAAGIGIYPEGRGTAGVIAGAVLGAVAGTILILITYFIARRQWAKPRRTGRIQEWYDLIEGLLLASILLALGVVLRVVGDLIGRVVGALLLAFAIRIARPRLAELQRRRRPTAGPH
jgi:uncharacterized membrane-anchored protein